jgi:hypothetical protein
MQHLDDRYHLRIQFQAKQCQVSPEQRLHIQQGLEPLGVAVQDFTQTDLALTLIYHPHSDAYHVDARLQLPGQTLTIVERDGSVDQALERCVHDLIQKVEAAREHLNSTTGSTA